MPIDKFIMKGKKPIIQKDPDAALDYTVDFTAELTAVSDTILSSEVLVSGVTLDSSLHTDYTVTAWISGGVVRLPGEDYAFATFRYTSVNDPNRINDRTIYFDVLEK